MPELPEVQTIVDDLCDADILDRRITRIYIHWKAALVGVSLRAFQRYVTGDTITTIWRRGKYIVFVLSNEYFLLLHLRMTGRLQLIPRTEERDIHEHVIFEFDNGMQLRVHDTRKFGRVYLVKDVQEILGKLGPEPLDKKFTADILKLHLTEHARLLKPLLLDQTFIAGLGNIYVDEALWKAGIHPCRSSSSLSDSEIKALYQGIGKVLRQGLKYRGTSLGLGQPNFTSVGNTRGSNWQKLKVFQRTDTPCPRCRTTIKRIVVGQRSTHICPQCQRLRPQTTDHRP